MSTPPRRRPGGRNAAVRLAVAHAVLSFLEQGQPDFSVADVAARAGVHRATVYRRWPTRAALLAEALSLQYSRITVPMTGDFVADLRTLSHRLAHYLAEPVLRTVNGMAIAGSEPGFGALVNTHWEPVKQRMTDLIEAGIRSGQLRRDTDPDAIIRLLVGPLLMTPLFTQAGATKAQIDQTTDAILRAFLARP